MSARRRSHPAAMVCQFSRLARRYSSRSIGGILGNRVAVTGVPSTSYRERTAMRRYLVAAAVVALLVPALAAAKGPSGASISGPGLDRTLTISGDGEGLGTQLGNLAMRSGFFA